VIAMHRTRKRPSSPVLLIAFLASVVLVGIFTFSLASEGKLNLFAERPSDMTSYISYES
jgi:hypothetical protein